jgi:hypothetical protein
VEALVGGMSYLEVNSNACFVVVVCVSFLNFPTKFPNVTAMHSILLTSALSGYTVVLGIYNKGV